MKVSLEGAGRACELDLSRGRVSAVDHDVRGERTNLSVELAPLTVRVFELDLDLDLDLDVRAEAAVRTSVGHGLELAVQDWNLYVLSEKPDGVRPVSVDGVRPVSVDGVGPATGVGSARWPASRAWVATRPGWRCRSLASPTAER